MTALLIFKRLAIKWLPLAYMTCFKCLSRRFGQTRDFSRKSQLPSLLPLTMIILAAKVRILKRKKIQNESKFTNHK